MTCKKNKRIIKNKCSQGKAYVNKSILTKRSKSEKGKVVTIASCGATFDSVLEQHWLQDHIGSNYHTRCTKSTASPVWLI